MSNRYSAMRRSVPRWATVLGILAICLGASSKSCRIISDNIEDRDRQSFITTLTLQDPGGTSTDTFDRGDPIELVLTVRNELETRPIVEFPSTRTFDFVVVRAGTAEVVWRWSDGQTFQQITSEIEFEPEETQTFRRTWNQAGTSGVQVRSGTYEARGVLVFSGFDTDPLQENQLGSALVRFTIVSE